MMWTERALTAAFGLFLVGVVWVIGTTIMRIIFW